ncbi:MAG: 7-cyano-7-deazaguanine synthase [Candidatus Omnitrophica bacterium]|nr:7-cyano-7-deazaguanine synthase [Candidatus Omnitrophota bacterium]
MICKKCVLPEHKPDIWLNDEGVCNICLAFDKAKSGKPANNLLETELVKLLNKARSKEKYDCLLMCSGGKDSTLSLYYLKKKYRMNPLAFTFDHGFENSQALENVKNAVNILGVDWMYIKSDFMRDVFAKIIQTGSSAPICHVCAIWYLGLTYDTAIRFNIPLIIGGWTKGQAVEEGESGREYLSMSKATADFISSHLNKDPRYRNFPRSIKELTDRVRRKKRILTVSPHWFLPYDPAGIMETLKKELKWKAPDLSYPKHSTNCLINFASVFESMKNYGYTHYHIEMSKLIRKGELTREEALRLLEIDFDKEFVNRILSKTGCQLQ